MFQLLLIFSTDFWNNAPLIFHRNCQFWLERVKETNVYSDLVLQPGPTSRAMPSPKGNHNINIKWGTKSQKQPPHTTPGPGSNKDWQKLPNIDCLKLHKTMYNSSFREGFIFSKKYCGFWSNRTLLYFPLSVRSSVRPLSVTGVTYQLFSIF